MRGAVSLALAVALIAFARPAMAQQSIALASISGRVVDSSGLVVPGARVSAHQLDTNVTTVATSDAEGRFRFPYLPVGRYDVVAEQPGFITTMRSVTLTAGAAFELPLTLTVAGLAETVTVTAAPTVLDAARTQIASTVSQAELGDLPLNGRQFLDAALLVPGVSPANVASTQLFPETSAVPGVSLSVSSQRNLSNNFVVDGLSANDDAAALSGIAFGVDAIEQVQVVTSGAQAELGRALGGYINVVTRSGTNVAHGTAYGYFRDDRLNAENPLLGRRLPMRQAQFGASLGGPIQKNRTFYFTNVEERNLDQSGLVTIAPDAAAAINARLTEVGYRGPLVSTGVFRNPLDSTTILAKVDRMTNRGQLTVRYNLYRVSSDNARGAGGLSAPSAASALDNRDDAIAVNHTLAVGDRTVVETRAQVAHGSLDASPTDSIGPAVSIAGVASFGRLSSSPTARTNTLYQIVNNVSRQAGSHAVRAGADVLYNDDRISFPRAAAGTYSFSSLANFSTGVYNTAGFSQTFGATDVVQTNPNLGLYAQDEWKVTPSVTLNLGVRYDLQWLDTIHLDTNNVAPRLGAAWVPFAARRTVVRGSAGLFYDRVPLRAVANALLSAGNTTDVARLRQNTISLSPAQAGAPTFPRILAGAVPSITLPNLTTMDRHLQNAHSRQASVEVEQQIGDAATVSVGYQYVRGLDLLMSINQNVATCIAAATNNGCRPVAAYANDSRYSSAGSSAYHGLHVSLVQRASRWGHLRVSYTLSRSMNDVGEFFFSSPLDPFDVNRDWGRSDDDQRHRLVVSGTVQSSTAPASSIWEHFTRGYQASVLLQAYSAPPLNITSGVTTIQGTAARPLADGPTRGPVDVRAATFVPRNAGEGSNFLSLNARLTRTFHLGSRVSVEGTVEAFNLTNRHNVLTRNGTFGTGAYPTAPSASFRQVTAIGEPRSLQLSTRVRF
jgi:hypothetical protein